MLVIEEATEADGEVVEAIARLLPLLSKSAPAPTRGQVSEVIDSPATTLFIARDGSGGPIIGTLTLAVFRIPTAVRAWIEDVIVAEEARGKGCGEALTVAAIEAARAAGAKTVELTSRPSREAANRLYRRIGFVERETNVYRYEVTQP
ncbi:MAG TPA: GNAT family N-acetyltransferase [Acidimicrobiales bacterium]|nr:GNAT family N-acetyltransferase [Acidimicrobiales bacterium]